MLCKIRNFTEDAEDMRKCFLSILLCGIMSISLVACDKKPVGSSDRKIKIDVTETMQAFKTYYEEYSEEHYMKDIAQYDIDYMTSSHWDCIGKMVFIENQPMMMIADLVGVSPSSEDFIYNIRVFSYENGEVVEKYTVKDLITWDDGFFYDVNRDTILICSEAYCFGDNKNTAIYELKDGEVKSYMRTYNENDDIYIFCQYLDNDCTPTEVDKEVENYYKYTMMPYNYFMSDCNTALTENKYYGALTQEDFLAFLDELAKLEDITSEQQVEKAFCDFVGYYYSEIRTTDENTTDISQLKLIVNDEKYTFSIDEGVVGLSEMPTYAQSFLITGEVPAQHAEFVGYYKTEGFHCLDEKVNDENVGCILGSSRKYGDSDKQVDIEKGTMNCKGMYNMFGLSFGFPMLADTNDLYGISYNNIDNGCLCEYGFLKLNFVSNYEFDGLTKDSSVSDILDKGYRQGHYEGVYYNIYSELPVDFSAIDSDYEQLYNSGISEESVYTGAFDQFIPYANEYIGIIPYTAADFSDKTIYTINAENEQLYNNSHSPNMGLASYADVEKETLSIASQMNLLNRGDIDYFVIAQIDTTEEEPYAVGWSYPGSIAPSEPRYEDNVLSLYIISNKEDYVNWLQKAGWIVLD